VSREILLATTSAGKVSEIRAAASGLAVRWRGLEEFPGVTEAIEDGATFAENARKKALHYAAAAGVLTLADDSGLEVDALHGAPGVDSAYFAGRPRSDAANNRKLIAALAGVPVERRTARFVCHMVLAGPGAVEFECCGRVEGVIVDEPRGSHGFGYDPHFFLPRLNCTAAELPTERKNEISHRGAALRQVLAWLRARRVAT